MGFLSAKTKGVRKAARRKRALPRAAMIGLTAAGTVVVACAFIWAVGSGWFAIKREEITQSFFDFSARNGLALTAVAIEGRVETPRADVLAAIGANRGGALLGLDIAAIRARLESLPWVVSAVVERHFPDRLSVTLQEAKPLALWQRDQQLYLVSREGKILATKDLGKYADLLIVVGEDAPRHAEELLTLLESQSDLRAHVQAAVFVGKRRWNLHMDNGVDIKLPETGAAEAWQTFADIERAQGLLEKDIRAVDLRLPDRIVVQQAHPDKSDGMTIKKTDKKNET